MENTVKSDEGMVIVRSVTEFDPEQILFCGQAFRWRKEGCAYAGIAYGRLIHLEMRENDLCIYPSTGTEFREIWEDYFDLKRDYPLVKRGYEKDVILRQGMEYASGMRVLNQQPFETMISFILSANNNIRRITGIIERLCEWFGQAFEAQGGMVYAFPEARALAEADVDCLKACGAGYRAPYVKAAAQAVCGGFDLEGLRKLPYAQAKQALVGVPGIGPKVADCILLYSLGFAEAFPLDVWVKRAVYQLYGFAGKTGRELEEFIRTTFGENAGIAQQYLFHYVRKNRLGICENNHKTR